MNNDINSKINSILSGMSAKDVQQIMQMAKNSGVASKLTPSERERLINEFSKLDASEIKRKMSKVNSQELSKLSADELIKKLRSL
ncbi:MAG: hypothetical protein IJ300_05165 [Clostridia bacterium]|nr:hypothetical protein [Clostridia bacterium]